MQAQPGFVSAQLHRGVGSSRLLTNTSVWESSAALRNALSSPEFAEKSKSYPDGIVVYPHIFQKVAVDGVCGA
jgi:quinol monooxygenase YgiN